MLAARTKEGIATPVTTYHSRACNNIVNHWIPLLFYCELAYVARLPREQYPVPFFTLTKPRAYVQFRTLAHRGKTWRVNLQNAKHVVDFFIFTVQRGEEFANQFCTSWASFEAFFLSLRLDTAIHSKVNKQCFILLSFKKWMRGVWYHQSVCPSAFTPIILEKLVHVHEIQHLVHVIEGDLDAI